MTPNPLFVLANAWFVDRTYAWIALAYFVVSIITFIAYGIDKRAAVKNHRRIPEIRLHTLEALGGWPGAFVAQHLFRHKNRKLSYQIVFWAIVLTHLAVWGFFIMG